MATIVRCLSGLRNLGSIAQTQLQSSQVVGYQLTGLSYCQRRRFNTSAIGCQSEASASKAPKEGDVKLTDAAIQQLKKITASDNSVLRVSVEGGGCSGFQYKFALDTETTEDDRVFSVDGARLVIDPDTMEFLHGATVDYHQEMIRSSFIVQDNPKAEHGCSCGSSFSIKL